MVAAAHCWPMHTNCTFILHFFQAKYISGYIGTIYGKTNYLGYPNSYDNLAYSCSIVITACDPARLNSGIPRGFKDRSDASVLKPFNYILLALTS